MISIESEYHELGFARLLEALKEADYTSEDPELLLETQLTMHINNTKGNRNTAQFDGTQFIIPASIKPYFNQAILDEVTNHYLKLLNFGEEISWLAGYLRDNPFSKRAIINTWHGRVDSNTNNKCPCVVYFIFRKTKTGLDMGTHMRSNDINRKMLLNLYLFDAIHTHTANLLKETKGAYSHYVDSLIVHAADQDQFNLLTEGVFSNEESISDRN